MTRCHPSQGIGVNLYCASRHFEQPAFQGMQAEGLLYTAGAAARPRGRAPVYAEMKSQSIFLDPEKSMVLF